MPLPDVSYRFYATSLDAYTDFLNSDNIYEKYWGGSENPPHTPEEFREKQFKDLIDRLNRVPFDSEAADRGTAFNEVVDCLVLHQKSDRCEMERVTNYDGTLFGIAATYNNRRFVFPIALCREFAQYYEGAIPQLLVSGILPTAYGNVELYGYIDELMPLSVHDIKTTGNYSVGKFKNHWQHLVYPYCLITSGTDIRTFEYNVVELSKNGTPQGTFTETYVFEPERDVPKLRDHCESFIRFLEENRSLITDKKLFNLL